MSDSGPGAGAATPAETPLLLVGTTDPLGDAELAELYGYPDPRPGGPAWVRANFISSVDGGATVAGRSGGLAGAGDRRVFSLLRALADVILVGAGTVRTENYGGAHLGVGDRQRRRAAGQAEVPQIAIVTRSGRLDRDMRVFTDTEVPPLVLTCTDSAPATRERLGGHARVLDCSAGDPAQVDQAAVLAAITGPGRHRVLTEGGPTLLGALIADDLLDELCLTTAPYLVGGAAVRIAGGDGAVRTRMHRAHLLADESGYLYSRHIRAN